MFVIFNSDDNVIAKKSGQFSQRDQMYQQLFALPKIGEYYVQVSTFTAGGNYAGAGVRVDSSMIINSCDGFYTFYLAYNSPQYDKLS